MASIRRQPSKIENGRGPERGVVGSRCILDAVPLIVHAFVATTAMARSVTYLIQAAIARTHPARLGRAADHESEVPNIMCISPAACEATFVFTYTLILHSTVSPREA